MTHRVVIDTNVLVSAILSTDGAAREVLRRCLRGEAQPLIGNALFLEYEEILSREELLAAAPIGSEDRTALLDAVLSVCRWVNISFLWRPNLPDESDNPLIEPAVAGNADWILTGNTREIAAGELAFGTFRIGTPRAWLQRNE